MRKQRLTFFTIGVGVLILMVVFFFASTARHRSDYIRLPEQSADTAEGEGSFDESNSDLPLLEITPETVQQAIETLSRPESYSRSVSITTFWSDGSATDVMEVAVQGEMMRVDAPASGGSTRHLLSDGISTAIWYDDEETYRLFTGGAFPADVEQRIPSYEDILALEVEEISVAVYGEYEGIYCISVLTAEDQWGHHTAYWISLETGLLIAAEVLDGEELIYRMTALTLGDPKDEDHFLLGDGTALQKAEEETPPPVSEPKPPVAVEKPPVQVGSPSDLVIS